MSQNTEQNAFRSRADRLVIYPESVCVGRYSGDTLQLELDSDDLDADRLVEGPVLYVRCDIAHRSQTEAEARGAAEERAKGADEPVGYLTDTSLKLLRSGGYESVPLRAKEGSDSFSKAWGCDHPLYTRPANVAALEAQKSDGWEPIEGAPKDGTMVDLWVRPIWNGKARRVIDAWWTDRTGWRSGTEVPIEGKVTFWRACPPAPGNSPQVQAVAPASDPFQVMTDDQLSERLKAVQARWDELMDSDEELGGGSPMESMDEEMQSLQNEIARRTALTREGGV